VTETRVYAPDPLRTAWAEWLAAEPWQWFGNFTFPVPVHPEAAHKSFRYWTNVLSVKAFGRQRARHPEGNLIWARGMERQKDQTRSAHGGVIHFHAVLMNCRFLSRLESMYEWETISGGFARILPPENIGNVLEYVSKYITKGGEIDLSENLIYAPAVKAQIPL